jgi:hypothetical protein
MQWVGGERAHARVYVCMMRSIFTLDHVKCSHSCLYEAGFMMVAFCAFKYCN